MRAEDSAKLTTERNLQVLIFCRVSHKHRRYMDATAAGFHEQSAYARHACSACRNIQMKHAKWEKMEHVYVIQLPAVT